MNTSLLENSWRRCWQGLAANGSGLTLMQHLLGAWREPHRYYHSEQHLLECLQLFEQHSSLAQAPAELEMALWFHDAIYDTQAHDNEVRSADWAVEALTAAGVTPERVDRIKTHILATQHTVLPQMSDEQLLVDIDLAILGADSQRYEQYECQIRQEYYFVPEVLFTTKRREILSSFLSRDVLYSTAAMRQALDKQARINLGRSLKNLPPTDKASGIEI
ncbi:MAG: hypothetical protein ACK5ME_06810 [Parahaliea sp.]